MHIVYLAIKGYLVEDGGGKMINPRIKDRRTRGRVFFTPLNSLSCIYLYSHIIALHWQISSVQTALAQWITHPKMCRSTPYYISDCVTSTSVIAISDKLIHVFDFVCRYLHFYQTFTVHFFHNTSFFSSFFIPSSPIFFFISSFISRFASF